MSHNEKKGLSSLIYKFEETANVFTEKPIIALFIIGIIAITIRLSFLETELPIRQDANGYFWYAMDMSILNHLPYSHHANDGWPRILSVIFSIFNFNNYLDYTIIQRITTVIISVLTIIPVYYFCRKFFQSSYSLVGVALFVFEPHIIQNSLLGLTEPLYIFLGISSLSLFLSENKKLMYISFAIVAFATLVRAEGIILFIILSVLFFNFNKKNKKTIVKFFLSISIFIIILSSMAVIKANANNGFESSTVLNIGQWAESSIDQDNGISINSISKGVETLIKRLAQTMIPYFALFVPFGLIVIFKEKNKNKILIIISLLIYSIASVRMFSVVTDLRLILILYPLFAILSVYTIQHLTQKSEFKKIFLVLTICGCLVLSTYFLYSEIDSSYEKEANRFADYMVSNVKVSNNFYPESGYVYSSWVSSNLEFPTLSYSIDYNGPELLDYVKNSYDYLEKEAESIEEYIILSRDQGLTHLVVDGTDKRSSYFNDLFYNEEKYQYLTKEFDSTEQGYKQYKVKVFKINYSDFEKLKLE